MIIQTNDIESPGPYKIATGNSFLDVSSNFIEYFSFLSDSFMNVNNFIYASY